MYKPFFNYKKAIHPDCGKEVKIHQDIIITPFYTEEFCDHLVEVAKFYDKKFTQSVFYVEGKTHNLTKNSPWDTLYLSRISLLLFEDFCDHYEKFICPLIEKNFSPLTIAGWFSPMIIKYSEHNQKVQLHNDVSLITLNLKLNTDYKGSVLEFPRQNWTNKGVPKGWCYLWPSRVTHPHKTTSLKKGTKYTLSSWTHPPSWAPDKMGGSIYAHV